MERRIVHESVLPVDVLSVYRRSGFLRGVVGGHSDGSIYPCPISDRGRGRIHAAVVLRERIRTHENVAGVAYNDPSPNLR